MGLVISHGCWDGPCSSFNDWRARVAEAAGYPALSSMLGYEWLAAGRDTARLSEVPTGKSWEPFAGDALSILLQHSDCEGAIASADCGTVADRLEQVLAAAPLEEDPFFTQNPELSFAAMTRRFVAGLRSAASAGEDVEFR